MISILFIFPIIEKINRLKIFLASFVFIMISCIAKEKKTNIEHVFRVLQQGFFLNESINYNHLNIFHYLKEQQMMLLGEREHFNLVSKFNHI